MKLKFIAIMILILTSVLTSSAEPTPTTPIQVNFNYKNWGSYYTVSYAGEQYFAGYGGGTKIDNTRPWITKLTFDTISNSGQMHKVLMNDNIPRFLNKGELLPLGEGYQLKIDDHWNEGNSPNPVDVYVDLLQNGWVYDSASLSSGRTYVYAPFEVGNISDLPIIVVHVSEISSASVTFDGIFHISKGFIKVINTNGSISYVTVTPVIPPIQTPRPTPTPTKGSISVSSSPSGASIYLDGEYKEKTPKTITDVSIGSHVLEFTFEGYKPGSEFIEVSTISTLYVSISLIPIVATPTPTLTPTVTPSVTPTPTVNPSPIATANLEQEVKELKERLNKTEEKQSQQENKKFWLESAINSIFDWLKSIF